MPLPNQPWTTITPVAQDVPGVQQPNLTNDSAPGAADGHRFLVQHLHALRDKLQNAYNEIGTTPGNLPAPTSLRYRVAALEGLRGTVTTLNAAVTPIVTKTLTDPSVAWFDAMIIGRDTSGAARLVVKMYVAAHREGGGAVLDDWIIPYQFPLVSPWAASVAPVGSDLVFSVAGAVGVTINWSAIIGYEPVT